mmetsp:Transcript_48639/g.125296  ORF Transcript_48639/g.125296 Transcript_48639/m.125296 type:complete len:295 (+) Transcript_48639:861-1745(+)
MHFAHLRAVNLHGASALLDDVGVVALHPFLHDDLAAKVDLLRESLAQVREEGWVSVREKVPRRRVARRLGVSGRPTLVAVVLAALPVEAVLELLHVLRELRVQLLGDAIGVHRQAITNDGAGDVRRRFDAGVQECVLAQDLRSLERSHLDPVDVDVDLALRQNKHGVGRGILLDERLSAEQRLVVKLVGQRLDEALAEAFEDPSQLVPRDLPDASVEGIADLLQPPGLPGVVHERLLDVRASELPHVADGVADDGGGVLAGDAQERILADEGGLLQKGDAASIPTSVDGAHSQC